MFWESSLEKAGKEGWARTVVAQQMDVEEIRVEDVRGKVASQASQGQILEKGVHPQGVGEVS